MTQPTPLQNDPAAGTVPTAAELAGMLTLNADGLLPAVVQEADTDEVLMLAWMDPEALARTLATGRATYWSRSRQEYWVKGETSGNVQHLASAALDCDGDTVLLRVRQTGPACHTGTRTCFTDRELATGADSGGRPDTHEAGTQQPGTKASA